MQQTMNLCWLTTVVLAFVLFQGSQQQAEAKTKNLIDIYRPEVFDIAVLRNRKPVIVFFAPSKCSLCTRMLTKLESIAQDNYSEDLYLARFDMDQFPDMVERLGVSQIPTVRSYNKGVMLEEVRGLKMPMITDMLERVSKVGKFAQRFKGNYLG